MKPSEQEIQEAIEAVRKQGYASSSLIQRRLNIGYVHALNILKELEERGIVSPANGAQPRSILK